MVISPSKALDGAVTKIVNGSTLSVYTEAYRGYVTVRLLDIEVSRYFNARASTLLKQYALDKHCNIGAGIFDKTYALIAKVTCDGIDLRTVLLENGYALISSDKGVEQFLVDSQKIAQETDAGVWKGINEKARKRREHMEKRAKIKAEIEKRRVEDAARKEEERLEKIRRQTAARNKESQEQIRRQAEFKTKKSSYTSSSSSMTKDDVARQLGATAGIMGSCGPEYDDALKRVSYLAGKYSLDKDLFDANLLSTITTKYSASRCREVRDTVNKYTR